MTPTDLQAVADGKRLMDSNEQQRVAMELLDLRHEVQCLLQFIFVKYKDVKTIDDWKCPYHRRLAEMVGFHDAAREIE